MKFADPLKVICPECGSESLQSVVTLLALKAECPACHRSLRQVGEGMNGEIRTVKNSTIATLIALTIEKIDDRIAFSDAKIQKVSSLSDLVAVVECLVTALPQPPDRRAAQVLVDEALKEMLPPIERQPMNVALVDAFGMHLEFMIERFERGRN